MDRRITVKLPKETVQRVRKKKEEVEKTNKDGHLTFTSFLNELVCKGLELK